MSPKVKEHGRKIGLWTRRKKTKKKEEEPSVAEKRRRAAAAAERRRRRDSPTPPATPPPPPPPPPVVTKKKKKTKRVKEHGKKLGRWTKKKKKTAVPPSPPPSPTTTTPPDVAEPEEEHDEAPWERRLREIYFDPRHPASFQGANKLLSAARREGERDLKLKDVKLWLQQVESYGLNKVARRAFTRNRVVTAGPNDQWDADLADYQKLADDNDGYTFLLVAVDLFTRYACVEPIKKKTNEEVIASLRQMFARRGTPRSLRTDAGKEFTGREIEDFYDRSGVNHFITLNEVKANYAERLVKTIKSKLWRYMVEKNTLRYIDTLQDIVASYNDTVHSTTGMAPSEIRDDDERGLWWSQYAPQKPFDPKRRRRREPDFAYKRGDYVRIPTIRHAFSREYGQRWTGEVFVVDEAFERSGVKLYRLVDQSGDFIAGTFYESELQRVDPDRKRYWKVEEIVREEGDRVLVRWRYWPEKFNTWIKRSRLQDYR